MATKLLKEYHCLRCGKKWWQRIPGTPEPKNCARCKSPNWKTRKKVPKYLQNKKTVNGESK